MFSASPFLIHFHLKMHLLMLLSSAKRAVASCEGHIQPSPLHGMEIQQDVHVLGATSATYSTYSDHWLDPAKSSGSGRPRRDSDELRKNHEGNARITNVHHFSHDGGVPRLVRVTVTVAAVSTISWISVSISSVGTGVAAIQATVTVTTIAC